MSEEKKKNDDKAQTASGEVNTSNTAADTGDTSTDEGKPGTDGEELGLIDKANNAAERTEKATADLKRENDRAEKIEETRLLAGKGQAGQPTPVKKSDDELWAEDAKKRYEGTGMSPVDDKISTDGNKQ